MPVATFSANFSRTSATVSFMPTNGSGTRTILTGVDNVNKGGMIMAVPLVFNGSRISYDSVRNAGLNPAAGYLALDTDAVQTANTAATFNQFLVNGFQYTGAVNSQYIINWLRTAGFMDIVTYTGDTTSPRVIPHALGVVPDMMWVKRASSSVNNWAVYHTGTNLSFPGQYVLELNTTAPMFQNSTYWADTTPSSTTFTVGNAGAVNGAGAALYVAYLFGGGRAGTYTGNGSASGPFVNTGRRPKLLLIKRKDNINGNWLFYFEYQSNIYRLLLNGTSTCVPVSGDLYEVQYNSTGFTLKSGTGDINASGVVYLYYEWI